MVKLKITNEEWNIIINKFVTYFSLLTSQVKYGYQNKDIIINISKGDIVYKNNTIISDKQEKNRLRAEKRYKRRKSIAQWLALECKTIS